MAEYIEREKVLNLFDKVGCYLNPKCLERQKQQIEQLPTADVVEVVRCKDCESCDSFYPCKAIGEEEPIRAYYCERFEQYRKANDFCSYGEKRSEDNV